MSPVDFTPGNGAKYCNQYVCSSAAVFIASHWLTSLGCRPRHTLEFGCGDEQCVVHMGGKVCYPWLPCSWLGSVLWVPFNAVGRVTGRASGPQKGFYGSCSMCLTAVPDHFQSETDNIFSMNIVWCCCDVLPYFGTVMRMSIITRCLLKQWAMRQNVLQLFLLLFVWCFLLFISDTVLKYKNESGICARVTYAAFHSSREFVFTRSRDPGNHEFTTCEWNAF